jgi:APA family basic amino acid/polyamine antiporter
MNTIWRRKPVEAFQEDMSNSELKRTLNKWGLTFIGIGAIIGAGIFIITGLAAKEYAGPALVLSFVVAGLGCAFAALCYAEFASFVPVEGSAYAYAYATLGELLAWIIGWDLMLEYAMGASAVSVGWSAYLGQLLQVAGIKLPIWLMHDYYTATGIIASRSVTVLQGLYSSIDIPTIAGIRFSINLPAFIAVWLATAILIKGIRETTKVNNVIVILKLTVVVFVIILGTKYINTNNWHPFIPAIATFTPLHGQPHSAYGFIGILSGAAYIFFAYLGFDVISTSAGEAKNPNKSVPFAIILSLVICTVLFILMSLVLTGMVNYKDIDINAPFTSAFHGVGQEYAVLIISIAAFAGLTSVLLVLLLGQSRLFFAMAKDGLLPKKIFGTLHPKYKTPYKTSIVTALVVSLVAAFTPIDDISKMVNIGTLLAFIVVCASVWIMRRKEPLRVRPFKVPMINIVAPLGIIVNAGMMLTLGTMNWLRLILWLALGLVIYFVYSRKHSRLRRS